MQMETKLDDLEQYSKRLNLLVYGIPEFVASSDSTAPAHEDCEQIIIKLARKSGMNWVSPSTFHRVHRLGKFGSNSEGKPRPIIANFVSYKAKVNFIKKFIVHHKAKGFKDVKNIFLREHLTSTRLGLFKKLVAMRPPKTSESVRHRPSDSGSSRSNLINKVIVRDGSIRVYYGARKQFAVINNEYDFNEFVKILK